MGNFSKMRQNLATKCEPENSIYRTATKGKSQKTRSIIELIDKFDKSVCVSGVHGYSQFEFIYLILSFHSHSVRLHLNQMSFYPLLIALNYFLFLTNVFIPLIWWLL